MGKGKNRIKLYIDTKPLIDLAHRFDTVGDNVESVVIEALTNAAEDVGVDTLEAMAKQYLPQKGKYSHGNTKDSVILHPKAVNDGNYISIGMGFDNDKPGSGTLLITGTPKMRPNYKLEDIFARKKYLKEMQKTISESIQDLIGDVIGK